MACMDAMMVKVPKYDPTLGKPFSAYVSRFIEDALLRYRMQEESWSYDYLGVYKKVRRAAWLYHNSESRQKAIAAFAEEKRVSTKKAASYVEAAMRNRRQPPLYLTDEDGNETGDVVGQSDFPELAEFVHSYINRESVSIGLLQQAFAALKDDMDKDLIESRIGCCIHKKQETFVRHASLRRERFRTYHCILKTGYKLIYYWAFKNLRKV